MNGTKKNTPSRVHVCTQIHVCKYCLDTEWDKRAPVHPSGVDLAVHRFVNLSEIIQAQVPGFCRLGLGFSDGQVAGCYVDDVGTIFLMNSSSDLSSWLRKLFFWKGVSEQTSLLTDPCVSYPSVSPEKHTGLVSQPHRYEEGTANVQGLTEVGTKDALLYVRASFILTSAAFQD